MVRIGVGVDIGHSSVKIIQLAKYRERTELNAYSKIPFATHSIVNGQLINTANIVITLKHAVALAHLKSKKVVTTLTGEAVMIRNLKLPLLFGAELTKILQVEIERFIPYPLAELEYDWDIINQDPVNGEMELMVVATQKPVIAALVKCIGQAGLQPLIVEAQPLAALRSLGIGLENKAEEPGAVAILDSGAELTQMAIYHDGGLRVTRIINNAGDHITKAISQQLQISPEKAEAIKCNLGDADYIFNPNNSKTEIFRANQVIKDSLTELSAEIRRSCDYFKLEYKGTPLRELILTGGSSKLKNLAPYLQRELALTVNIGDPLAGLPLNLKQTNRAVLLGNPNQFSVALGLALRGVDLGC